MGVFSVYNSHDSITAHHLFAMQDKNDVFSDIYQGCTVRVKVTSAFFREEYRGPQLLHKPYMEINGAAQSVFLEKDDSRVFPCGFKELELMQEQKVRIQWNLSIEELTLLTSKGLFTDYGDFDVPMNLVGNVIEIPMTIKYTGIYESPVAAVEILDPMEVYTCVRENTYWDIFEAGCYDSKQVEDEKKVGFNFCPLRKDYSVEAEDEQQLMEAEAQTEELPEETVQQSTLEDEEDKAVLSAVDKLVQMQTADDAARRAAVDKKQIATLTARANELKKQQADAERLEREASMSDTIFGVDGEDNRHVDQKRASYEDFKKAVESLDEELAKAEEDANESKEAARKVDVAMDNQALNAGNDDIAGYAAEQTLSDEQYLGETDEQKQEREDKKSGKAQIEAARRQDIAADNKALNEGITDIAGQGASSVKPRRPDKVSTAADLIANLSAAADPSSPGSSGADEEQYL